MEGFNDALADTRLFDMELVGHQYTCERGRDTEAWTEVRLNRALITTQWLTIFPEAKLYNLEGLNSDHSPLFLIPNKKIR